MEWANLVEINFGSRERDIWTTEGACYRPVVNCSCNLENPDIFPISFYMY